MRLRYLPHADRLQQMSTHLVTVRLTVINSAFTDLQVIDLDVDKLPEDHPLILELRRAWARLEDELLAQAKKNPGDFFAAG